MLGETRERCAFPLTCDIIWKLQWRYTVLDIHIEHIVVFFAFVELLSTLTDSVHYIADFLP